ncbi:MAG: Uncharacterised protein [Opitutia bacterium UBA7350]|nr:MAG: Uncharacterised protein [Opitutae bacterium UBA7350]
MKKLIMVVIFLCLLGIFTASLAQAEESLPTLYQIHHEFISENGGKSNLDRLNSIIINGFIEQDDQKIAFRLVRKRPNKMRLLISLDDFNISTIYNGKKGWRKVSTANQQIALTEIEGSELSILATDSNFDSPFYSAFKNRKYITVVGFDQVNGEDAVRLDFDPAGNFGFKSLWLSLDHFQEIKMQRALPSKSDGGEPTLEEIIYEDFRLIDGVYWAKVQRYFENGEPVKVVTISDVRSNEGIYDSYFKVVKD